MHVMGQNIFFFCSHTYKIQIPTGHCPAQCSLQAENPFELVQGVYRDSYVAATTNLRRHIDASQMITHDTYMQTDGS